METSPDQRAREAEAFALTRAELQTRTVVRSLLRLRDRPTFSALPPATPAPADRRGTAIVVGAGPGLADHVDALRRAAGHATIFAVNASLGALRNAGIRASWVVARESLDQSHHLEAGGFDRAALDVACHPAIWDEAERHAPGAVHAFVAGATQFFQIADALDVRPLYGGTAALTAAVQLAFELGAKRIVLVGVDLAVVDGDAYSALSPYGAVKGEVKGDVVHFTETQRWDEGARRVGAVPEPKLQRADIRRCWDGVERPAMHASQLDWLGTFARRAARAGVECVDTSRKGIAKEGWSHDPEHGLAPWGTRPERVTGPRGGVIAAERAAALLDQIRAEVPFYQALAADPTSALRSEAHLPSQVIETMAAGATTLALREGSVRARIEGVARAFGEAAGWVGEHLPLARARAGA